MSKFKDMSELMSVVPTMKPEEWIPEGLKMLDLDSTHKACHSQSEIDFIRAACQMGTSACIQWRKAHSNRFQAIVESRSVLQDQRNRELQEVLDNLNQLKAEAGHMISNASNQQVFLNAVSAERDGLRDELIASRRENSQLSKRLSAASVDFQLVQTKAEKEAIECEVLVEYLKKRLLEALEARVFADAKPTMQDFTKRAHQTAISKGWWDGVDDADAIVPEKLCLIHSEVSEALESYRNGEDMLWITDFGKPEGLLAELADVVIRCADLSEALGLDLGSAMSAKMDYNDTRPHRHGDKKC